MYLCRKNNMMKYSIITINYNNALGLERTIISVVSQKYQGYEFIIIDGGSTDGSLDVIEKYSDKIDFWVSESDKGIYHAMNKGSYHANGDYCIFMNSGDCFYDGNVLDDFLAFLDKEDILVGKVSVDENNSIISPPPPDGELTLYHLYSGAIPHQGSFIKKELLKKYPYDENLKISSDWKFFIQTLILDNCSVRFLDIFVARYDLNGVSSFNPVLMRMEKDVVLAQLFPPRVIADYQRMKQSECLTQIITPLLKKNYTIDKIIYRLAKLLLVFKQKMV